MNITTGVPMVLTHNWGDALKLIRWMDHGMDSSEENGWKMAWKKLNTYVIYVVFSMISCYVHVRIYLEMGFSESIFYPAAARIFS